MRVIIHDPDYQDVTRHDSETSKKWLEFNDCVEVISVELPSSICLNSPLTLDSEVIQKLEYIESQVKERNLFAAGWISYEASSAFDASLVTSATLFPLLKFGLFSKSTPYESLEQIKGFDDDGVISSMHSDVLEWDLNTSYEQYKSAIDEIKQQIRAGNTYQVNYTLRQYADLNLSPEFLFKTFAKNALYGAFIDDGQHAICSASPELFFRKRHDCISAKPMKGTDKRGLSSAQDNRIRDDLKSSEKNRAENLMIVDMIRNDLSKVAEKGTVKVPALFDVERYPTVWQMTSTVEATTSASLVEIFKSLFPCASITGAPKSSTMKIIHQLEKTPRKVYCGAIGYIAKNIYGTCDAMFNVPIRTALIDLKYDQAEYGVGGGIIWESEAKSEYDECLIKSQILKTGHQNSFEIFETLLWEYDGQAENSAYFLLDYHLQRMSNSSQYFQYPFDENSLREKLQKKEEEFSQLKLNQRVRVVLFANGDVDIQNTALPIEQDVDVKNVKIIENSVTSDCLWLYHKTTNRDVYDDVKKQYSDFFDVILVNEHGCLTESTIANVIYKLDNVWYTPPVSDGLLSGTLRQQQLDSGELFERSLHISDLDRVDDLALINSVRRKISISVY